MGSLRGGVWPHPTPSHGFLVRLSLPRWAFGLDKRVGARSNSPSCLPTTFQYAHPGECSYDLRFEGTVETAQRWFRRTGITPAWRAAIAGLNHTLHHHGTDTLHMAGGGVCSLRVYQYVHTRTPTVNRCARSMRGDDMVNHDGLRRDSEPWRKNTCSLTRDRLSICKPWTSACTVLDIVAYMNRTSMASEAVIRQKSGLF